MPRIWLLNVSDFCIPSATIADDPVASQRQQDETATQENGDEDGRITFDDTSEFVRNVTLESRAAPVKRERAVSAGPSQVEQPVVVKIERTDDAPVAAADEDEEMDSEDEDEGLAEMAAREGLSLAEYRIKIDSQMQEMERVKAEGKLVCNNNGNWKS